MPPRPKAGPKTSFSATSTTWGRNTASPSAIFLSQAMASGIVQKSGQDKHERAALMVAMRISQRMVRTACTFLASRPSGRGSLSSSPLPLMLRSSISEGMVRRTWLALLAFPMAAMAAGRPARLSKSAKTPGAQAWTTLAATCAPSVPAPAFPSSWLPALETVRVTTPMKTWRSVRTSRNFEKFGSSPHAPAPAVVTGAPGAEAAVASAAARRSALAGCTSSAARKLAVACSRMPQMSCACCTGASTRQEPTAEASASTSFPRAAGSKLGARRPHSTLRASSCAGLSAPHLPRATKVSSARCCITAPPLSGPGCCPTTAMRRCSTWFTTSSPKCL
mmetsp:Transcript_91698/g.290954  ORF Transcript_91698/g.290954 Transcript_91698/m.290954 type:complete len:335 (-) Transcript_91698:217-1221(-)